MSYRPPLIGKGGAPTNFRRRPYTIGLPLAGFYGGLNTRDAWSELDPHETPAAMNVIYDERGAIVPRLGLLKLNAGSLLPQPPCYLYYSAVADAVLAYISTDAGNGKLYKSLDGGATWSAAYTGFTAGAKGAIVDFNQRVVVCNTIDGVYSFPSSLAAPTHTAGGTNNMDEARGAAIVVWQNRVIVAGDTRADATHSRARLAASARGDELTWNDPTKGSWTNDLREIDDQIVTAIGAGQGVDINQKPTLYVCKLNSAYRVNDGGTGAYTTLHSSGAGAASATAIAQSLGVICTVNNLGVWATDGIATPKRVSDKIADLFTPDGVNLATLDSWTAGVQKDRFVFNLARPGSASNNLQIEYHPQIGWLATHKGMGLGPLTPYTKNTRKLLAAAAAPGGQVYQVGKGGTDDGTPISCFWSSKDFSLLDGREARLRNMRVWGRGAFTVSIRTDYSRGSGDSYPFDFTGLQTGFQWGSGKWGTGTWGETSYIGDQPQALDEVARTAQITIAGATTTTANMPALLGDGSAPEVGAFGLYNLLLEYLPLGIG